MKTKLLQILIVLLTCAIIIASFLYYGIYVSPEKITIKYDTATSTKIPKSLDNVTIGYFSDIYYLEFMDKERLEKMIDEMKEAHVDVLLFGGDLFSNPTSDKISAEVIHEITELLASIEAPLGKFYVLGDIDCINKDSKTLVSNILFNAGFENMANKNIKIHNGKKEGITLIGLDNAINGKVNIKKALQSTSEKNFNVVFSHTPDPIASLPIEIIDIAIAGHSMGGQIRFPGFGSLKRKEQAEKYSYGLYTYNGNLIRISNGLGTNETDMRLFCPPQYNVIVLRKN